MVRPMCLNMVFLFIILSFVEYTERDSLHFMSRIFLVAVSSILNMSSELVYGSDIAIYDMFCRLGKLKKCFFKIIWKNIKSLAYIAQIHKMEYENPHLNKFSV